MPNERHVFCEDRYFKKMHMWLFSRTTSLLFPVSNKHLTTAIPRILLSVTRQPNKITIIVQ